MNRQQLLKLAQRSLHAIIDLVFGLRSEVRQLRRQVKALTNRLALNSRNSSRPPATDGPAKPAPISLRQKSGRKPGGQPGHTGRTLQPVPKPDRVIDHTLDICPCGQCQKRSLRGEPVIDYEKRQVFDLPVKLLEVTEHRAEIKICPVSGCRVRADFPQEVRAPAQYGARFKAVQTYLNVEHFLPFHRQCRLVEDIFGQPLSEATVVAANERVMYSSKIIRGMNSVVNRGATGVMSDM